ncbi:MAG: hypothetical protein LBJ70_02605 [Holosporales bacterium]|jgi:hypothetical protein|nr:hypothetical protein [Holosporales bacterium]
MLEELAEEPEFLTKALKEEALELVKELELPTEELVGKIEGAEPEEEE